MAKALAQVFLHSSDHYVKFRTSLAVARAGAYFVKLAAMLGKHGSGNGITTSSLLRRGCRSRKFDGGGAANAAHVATFVGNVADNVAVLENHDGENAVRGEKPHQGFLGKSVLHPGIEWSSSTTLELRGVGLENRSGSRSSNGNERDGESGLDMFGARHLSQLFPPVVKQRFRNFSRATKCRDALPTCFLV